MADKINDISILLKKFEYKESEKCKQCHKDTPMRYIFCRPGMKPCKAYERDDSV